MTGPLGASLYLCIAGDNFTYVSRNMILEKPV